MADDDIIDPSQLTEDQKRKGITINPSKGNGDFTDVEKRWGLDQPVDAKAPAAKASSEPDPYVDILKRWNIDQPVDVKKKVPGTSPYYVHTGDEMTDATAKPGAGFAKGIMDVVDTGTQGLSRTTAGIQNLLVKAGALPQSEADYGNQRVTDLDNRINLQNKQYEQEYGDDTTANIGRLGGNITASAPFMAAGGEVVAPIAGAVTKAAPGVVNLLTRAKVPQTLGGAMIGGSGAALTSSQSEAPLGDQVAEGALTGAVLNRLAPFVSGAGRAVRGGVEPETAQLADKAINKYGIPLYGGEISDSPSVRLANSTIKKIPFSGYAPREAEIQTGVNRAVAKLIGEDADKLTPQVMSQAKKRLSKFYDDFGKKVQIKADLPMWQDLHKVLSDSKLVMDNTAQFPKVAKLVDGIRDKIKNQKMSGDFYETYVKTGGPLDRLTKTNDREVAHAAQDIKMALRRAMERSAPSDMVDGIRTTNKQYAIMKSLEGLVEKSPTGNISPSGLMSAARESGNMAYGGGGDLAELARIGQKFLKEPGSSNTAERSIIMDLLRNHGGTAALAAIGTGAAFVHPDAALTAGTLLTLLTSGRIGGEALRSKWYTNHLLRSAAKTGARSQGPANQNLLTKYATPLLEQSGAIESQRP